MIEPDLDDTHLCIKCSSTIVGLENYIEHRKRNCAGSSGIVNPNSTTHKIATAANRETNHEVPTTIISTATANLDHTYEAFPFPEPEPPTTYVNKSEHGGKTSKSLTDSYDLPYELGADVFFSSLQLQSVQSTGPSTSGGKTHSSTPQIPLQRQKSSPIQQEQTEHAEVVAWNVPLGAGSSSGQQNTDTLMKAVSDMSDVKKPYEVFKPITFVHESPDASEDEEPEDEHDAEMDDDDEDYDPIAASHATGGKWKLAAMPHSPPVVPVTHTGGKWKPENRPNLRVTHTQLSRLSPNWGEQLDESEALEVNAEQHPPADHTKGKWVPGTKMQRLEFKEEVVELAKSNVSHEYWCNICCRKLKSKAIYESHLRTKYHLKRAETEQQLEKAALSELQHVDISKSLVLEAPKVVSDLRAADGKKKRKRSATFIKCQLCKHIMPRHLVGKHLISHYHYRRMQMNPIGESLHMILDNIHSIVLQSPFQCRPCRFYANTEESFLQHWNSPEHLDLSEGPGKFWCSYCHFECEDNNQMRRHLLSFDHKEVILAINRSVPICISKKLALECAKCRQSFLYNIELRKHMQLCHPGIEDTGTSSDIYQSRYNCNLCSDSLPSRVALQRHEKNFHLISKYFCSICNQQFSTACQARRHRKTLAHRICAPSAEKRISIKKQKSLQAKGVKHSRECNKCGFIATSEVEAMLHELSHSKSDFASSSTATAVSAKASSSKRSAKSTTRKVQASATKPIKCKDCTEVLVNVAALKLHRDSEHPLLSHVCLSCGQSFARAQALGQHSRVCKPTCSASKTSEDSTAAKSWNCDQCAFKATYESELIFHRLFHIHGPISKNQLIQCPLCPKEFRKDSLRCHLRLHTNEKIFECRFCNLKFSRRHNLTEHINKLHIKTEAESKLEEAGEKQEKNAATATTKNEKPTTSKAAAAAAVAEANVAEETRRAAGRKEKGNYQCDTCGKVFALKNSLKMHCLKHLEGGVELRKYVCIHEGCEYAATTKYILDVHLASHSRKDIKCEQPNCKYTGKSMRHLKRHQRSHTEASRPYACKTCDFKSRIKGHLRRHMLCHSGAKSHQCPHCDYRCSTLDNLRKHVLKTNKHTGKFFYECEQCTVKMELGETIRIFKTNSYQEYQVHLNNYHGPNKTKI